MIVEDAVQELRKTLLAQIEEAARRGDAAAIAGLGARLQRVERVSRTLDELKDEVRLLSDPNAHLLLREETTSQTRMRSSVPDREARTKQRLRARDRKTETVKSLSLKNVELSFRHGSIYTDQTGKRVGLAYAYEGATGNSWFLGLPIDGFDYVVLICEDSSAQVHTFLLPEVELEEVLPALTHARGQTKFHVSRRSGGFFLDVPGNSPVRIVESVPWPQT